MLRDGRICSIEYINGLLRHDLLLDMPSATNDDHDGRYIKYDSFAGDVYILDTAGITLTVGSLVVGGTIASGNITISSPAPILVLKDSNSLGAASVGYIEWRDSGGGRAGFFGNNTSGDDGLLWKNEQGGNIGIQTTGEGELQIFADTVVNGTLDIVHTAIEADDHALEIDANAAGFGDVKALNIDYITGDISAGEDEGIILINIDEILAEGGDIFALEVLATDGSAGIYGLKAAALVGPIHQDSGVFINPTTGTDNTTDTDVAAMIDGAVGTTTAIFENDAEYILIGAAAAFEEIEFILTTGSSGAGIKPTFAYSTAGAHQFTPFSPVDGTNGLRNTGVVAWDASDLTGHAVNTDTGTFDIKITRTRTNLGTTPVLGYAKTAATTEYIWDKSGNVNINDLTIAGTFTDGTLSIVSGSITSAVTITATDLVANDDVTVGEKIIHQGDADTYIEFPTVDSINITVGSYNAFQADVFKGDIRIGFFSAGPQAQQAHIIDADGNLADITTKFNTLLADLEGYGLLATA